jgi:hypothetical protein
MKTKREILTTTIAVLISVFLVAGIVWAVTTIGLNISTDGNVTIGGTLGVTGLTTASGGLTIPSGQSLNIPAGALSDGSVLSADIADGTIVDADVSSSAAIALSKLATGALPTGITVASTNIVDGTIATADIANDAVTDAKVTDDIQITQTGAKSVSTGSGGLTIGGGTAITKHLSATPSVTFNLDTANTCTVATTSISGASVGDTVAVGMPEPPTNDYLNSWGGWISAAGVASLKYCTGAATTTDGAYTVRFDVWKH